MNALLLEMGCEDLPARYVVPLSQALTHGIAAGLTKRGVPAGATTTFATPRRIAVLIESVASEQPTQNLERKGPAVAAAFKDGQPTPAALGFARSCGVAFEELAQEGGNLVFRKQQPGKATAELLPEIFEETLKAMDELVPKRMRWGAGSETFVRPVQWLLALLGSEIIPLRRFGLEAGRLTYGHRFHAPDALSLAAPDDYAPKLLEAKVWSDVASRKAEIRRQIEAEATKLGGTARISEDLLDEVTALVEWPVVISGRIEKRFLELPPEVIVATVETNQRYFTVFNEAGKLLPAFITISNIESKDVAKVIEGNERVVRPRLSDALFFWKKDLEQELDQYRSKLSFMTYQKQLGTLQNKVNNIGWIVEDVFRWMIEKNPDQATRLRAASEVAKRAADHCKDDLNTRMVYEFPELQGIMGGYYYTRTSELPAPENTKAVALAIAEHYRPIQAGSEIPTSLEGRVVALADKLDTLSGIFKIGLKPTASKDPYALRRAALGTLRIVVEGDGLDLNLRWALQQAWNYHPRIEAIQGSNFEDAWSFVVERLRGYCLERGATAEQFEAVRSLNVVRPLDFVRRLDALGSFWALPAAQSLTAAHKRVRNILKQAGVTETGPVDPTKFAHDAESALHQALLALPEGGDYVDQLTRLATLREPVDAFFDMRTPAGEPVMVNDPDAAVRANRLALLAALDARCRKVADISCLPG